ncbi:hypothetical protein BKA62DRAFT_706405 [Auriculariales sp. MPI-PUGE-AT-0066]|nr:hypothetical protein BKA62DRAFT_706405 [Auriculariales sp. MPI-PUGE-AT-0066]
MAALRVCTRQLPRVIARPCLTAPARRKRSSMPKLDEAGPSSRPDIDPWAHIFDSIDDVDSKIPTSQRPTRTPVRKQAMTRSEINAFENMFDMIFTAIDEQQARTGVRPLGAGLDGAAIGPSTGLGKVVDKVYNRKKDKSGTERSTTEDDAKLDLLREEMELCGTDAALLTWARNNVFTDTVANGTPGPTYPGLLALLMRAFRERFGDPHLALSVFEHARHLSVSSFVFGCTTPAYNELIVTRWNSFRDLKGVRDALEEMKVNGVECDHFTRTLVETIRREVGERHAWLEDSLTSGVVFSMIQELELLSAPVKRRQPVRKEMEPVRKETEHAYSRQWRNSLEWKYSLRDDGAKSKADGPDQMWSVNLFAAPAKPPVATSRPHQSLV